jgi:predicted Holliday junction resolvase-like endonuclease
VSSRSQIVDFFSLHRQIFGVCPHPDCGVIFRLSDCHIYLKKKPPRDWMDALDRMDARLASLEEKLQEKEGEMREEAREKGRRLAQKVIRRIDPIFTPRSLNPDDAKVIFHPIDYVVFNGMKDGGPMKNIILLDREGTTADQRRLQRSIERTVSKRRFEWQTLRVQEDGTVITEG